MRLVENVMSYCRIAVVSDGAFNTKTQHLGKRLCWCPVTSQMGGKLLSEMWLRVSK